MASLTACLCLAVLVHGGLADLEAKVDALARQVMLFQFYMEERLRSDGDSGLKQIRRTEDGTRPYHSPTAIGSSVCSMHDHPEYANTLGLGEFEAVLNGVQFRTRHNDYKSNRPSTTSRAYHAVEDISNPEVPPSVLAKTTIDEQMEEMKEYFRAFKEQDSTIRDYEEYFKAILCYLEGAWTTSTGDVVESFASDRHTIEATTWEELQEKVRFTSYTGRRTSSENYATLPTTIMSVENGTMETAQWNYRILCHPLKHGLQLNRLHMIDDLAARMAYTRSIADHEFSRAARFQINPFDGDNVNAKEKFGLLDKIMSEIPGKNNYFEKLTDDTYGLLSYMLKRDYKGDDIILNAGRYHRWFKVMKAGASGLMSRHRGFSDGGVFMAKTTQPEVAGMHLEECDKDHQNCVFYFQRWTYAIPLEIVYMTPLLSWNPYDIEHKPRYSEEAKYVSWNDRKGKTEATALNGTAYNLFYRTPAEFYGAVAGLDPADTAKGALWVTDRAGTSRKVEASGHRIFQDIVGLGKIRTRYPVMPLHSAGTSVWKEVDALKDIILAPTSHTRMFHEAVVFEKSQKPIVPIGAQVLRLNSNWKADHIHLVEITGDHVQELEAGNPVMTVSGETNGHQHSMKLVFRQGSGKKKQYFMDLCDGLEFCEHPRQLTRL